MKLLSSKIFAGYLLVIILLTGLILFFADNTTKSHYYETFQVELENFNVVLSDKIIEYIETDDLQSLESYINRISSKIDFRITIIDTNGIVLLDTKEDAKIMENHKNRPEIKSAIDGKKGKSIRYSSTVDGEMLYVAVPIFDKVHQKKYILRSSLFLSHINQLNSRLTFEILQIALIVVVISLIGVLFFTRSVTSPLNQLSLASHKVSLGDFDVKVFLKSKDEIQELANNFNNMTEKLKQLFDQVNLQREEYHILISSIQEGLIVLDEHGKILLTNRSFDDFVNLENVVGIDFQEIINNVEFTDLFNEVNEKKISRTKEIELFDNYFLCSTNYILPKNEIVVLFYNITEIKKLEKIKRDFVVNVSHELKTPLTAIKGFAETLEDEVNEESLHYLQIIMRHTNRLINIVQDLLILSELEHDNFKLLLTKIDVKVIVDNVIKLFEPKIKEKGISLSVNIEPNLPKLKLDVYRIEQVLVNLIDNAFKYTDEGSIDINIYQDAENDNVKIEVVDTGVGIKKEDAQRIFERFYIVDKSRSRRVGGTGLGLSIVKHIILNHGGDITIDSTYGNGTKFIICLPIHS